jgi:hypothetical protein
VTHPSVDIAQSGDAVDAVRTLQAELSHDYSEMHSAEVQLTEAILSAHAVTVAGRTRLQDIQRQLIEAINNPVAALDTPAGERHFLMFLRSKIAEIQEIVDTGALTDEDHAKLTRALASGYLLPGDPREDQPTPALDATMPGQAAGMLPAIGSALGALPQAAQGAATAPAQGAAGLAGAASPLAGLASGLPERTGEPGVPERSADDATDADAAEGEERRDTEDDEKDEQDVTDGDPGDRPAAPQPPSDREPPQEGPAQTRPAGLV